MARRHLANKHLQRSQALLQLCDLAVFGVGVDLAIEIFLLALSSIFFNRPPATSSSESYRRPLNY
jgi:hypothetical protein